MKLSHKIGMSACAALLAASGVASADVAAKNTYYAPNGVIVTATDGAGGAICNAFKLTVGTLVSTVVFYPGASGANLTVVSPATSPSATSAGSTTAYTCRAGTLTKTGTSTYKWTPYLVPAGGINGQTVPFACFADTQSGGAGDGGKVFTAGHLPVATASVTFNVAATHNGSSTLSAAVTEAVTVSGNTCTYETDGSWFAH